MKSLLSTTGKLILGIVLFTLGLGLVYAGCKYMNSGASGIIKKIDTIIYIICFMPAVYGLSLVLDALGLLKNKEKEMGNEKEKVSE